MRNRRRFLQMLSTIPFFGGLTGYALPQLAASRNMLAELGVQPIINAAGTYTMFTATLMWPEVVQAIQSTSENFVRLEELHDAVGRRIASRLGSEAAMVTSGAAGALTVGTAACITGTDEERILRIPDTTGMKNEVIIQKTHRFPYDHAVRNCGVRLVEVETRGELESAINDRTALMLFLNKAENAGQIGMEEFVELGRKHGVPTFNDAAADVPPVDNLTRYIKTGFDLVTFSGGKGIRGPQSAGLLLGRKDLIEAARRNTLPHSDTLGRGLKVNKEEMVGMLVALERYLEHDHEADWQTWQGWAEKIASAARSVSGVEAEVFIPEIANAVPHVRVRWDSDQISSAPFEIAKRLREGDPSIEVVPQGEKADDLQLSSWTLQPGEVEIVARRLQEALQV